MAEDEKTGGTGAGGVEAKDERGGRGRRRDWDSDSWWEERTLPEKVVLGILFGILGIGVMFALGWVVMALWNWLMPDLFGVGTLTYWKAWGLMALCWILFKSWGACGSGPRADRKRRRHLRRYLREHANGNGAAPCRE